MAQLILDWYKYYLRPCLYYDIVSHDWKRGLFHRWFEDYTFEYEPKRHDYVRKSKLSAVVEDEDGIVLITDYVRFIDSKAIMDKYDYTMPSEDSAKNT